MRHIIALFLSLVLLPFQANSQGAPVSLVCFSEEGLVILLNQVDDIQQVLSNRIGRSVGHREMSRQGCGYAQIPEASKAKFYDFLTTEAGLIFPIYRVKYGTTGQIMFAYEGVYLSDHWEVFQRGHGFGRYPYLRPLSCDAVDGLLKLSKRIPSYMFIPRRCRGYDRDW